MRAKSATFEGNPMRPIVLTVLTALALCAQANAQLAPESTRAVGDIVRRVLQVSGVPSASIAIAKDGNVALAEAYGLARVSPAVAATPAVRYKIGSISKQFTVSALLLLQEERKLSLEDRVAKYFPDLTRAGEITLRQILSHTSGYQDYYPLDYVAPFMRRDVEPTDILSGWAKIPLDFEPGTQWQYSNTNFVIAGLIAAKAAGMPLSRFLQLRILSPLGMHSAIDVEERPLDPGDAHGYEFYALGPPREAKPEGRGWVYATGELAMTARDLAVWDISLMNGSLLKPESMRELTTEQLLKGGTGTRYALGLSVEALSGGHRRWSHSGASEGFLCWNAVYPDDRISITVLTNSTRREPMNEIARKIEDLLLAKATDPGAEDALEKAKRLMSSLASGKPDLQLMSPDLRAYFTSRAVEDFKVSLQRIGSLDGVVQVNHFDRGGMVFRAFRATGGGKVLNISAFMLPDGRFSQFLIGPVPE
ncbi:MAG TPA: serine hydrolase domain-containing protein [Steroidobacteraceae bacterium]|jgi:CubicO group peptidase (beta-lactamase class C family)|nr:serine hydrolase domain-containing protein [Steroidobacteraceae bacterium]